MWFMAKILNLFWNNIGICKKYRYVLRKILTYGV